MAEEHNRAVSRAATDLRVDEPSVLLTAYSLNGEPRVVVSSDERVDEDTDALVELAGAVVTALAERRNASKEAIASYLVDRAEQLQVEAERERRRYEVSGEDSLDLPEE